MQQDSRKLKLHLLDKFGDESEIYIVDSNIVDENGFQVIDFENHHYKQKRDVALELPINSVKRFCDSFLMKPSPGFPLNWITKRDENEAVWQENLENFITAMHCLTGKQVIAIEEIINI